MAKCPHCGKELPRPTVASQCRKCHREIETDLRNAKRKLCYRCAPNFGFLADDLRIIRKPCSHWRLGEWAWSEPDISRFDPDHDAQFERETKVSRERILRLAPEYSAEVQRLVDEFYHLRREWFRHATEKTPEWYVSQERVSRKRMKIEGRLKERLKKRSADA